MWPAVVDKGGCHQGHSSYMWREASCHLPCLSGRPRLAHWQVTEATWWDRSSSLPTSRLFRGLLTRLCSPSISLLPGAVGTAQGLRFLYIRGEGRGWGGKVRMFYGHTNGFCGVSVWFSPLRITVDLLGVQCVHVPSLPSHPAFTGTVCLGVGSSCGQSPRHQNPTTLGRGPISPRSCEAVAKVVPAGGQWASWERTGTKTPVPAS